MSERLVVRPDVFLALQREAEAALPLECCGLLAGAASVIETILPVRNTADNGESQYEMDPAEMWAARRRATLGGLDVLGFYHSHPRTSPVPSSYDIDRAYYSDAVYLIAGLSPGFMVRAFRITGGCASEIHLEIEPAER
jgi:proteasome lid subunit RPN8/RPN11